MITQAEQDRAASLLEQVYDDLRRLARRQLVRERPDHTLQATALVHEAWIRLAGQRRVTWRGRTHYLAVAAQCMRRLLVDHARAHGRSKRGRGWHKVTLGSGVQERAGPISQHDLLALHEALDRLAALSARQARVVELRYFGGLTAPETADLLGMSLRTIEEDWTHARAWLRRALAGGSR